MSDDSSTDYTSSENSELGSDVSSESDSGGSSEAEETTMPGPYSFEPSGSDSSDEDHSDDGSEDSDSDDERLSNLAW